MSNKTRILAENQKQMLKLIAPATKKTLDSQNLEDSHSVAENTFIALTLTPIKAKTTTQNDPSFFFVITILCCIAT